MERMDPRSEGDTEAEVTCVSVAEAEDLLGPKTFSPMTAVTFLQ